MPRVNHVLKCRKEQQCGRCQTVIKVGEPYLHWKFRYGGKHKRCTQFKCRPRGSDLTQSKLASAYAACEQVEDLVLDIPEQGLDSKPVPREDWASDADSYIDEARSCVEQIREVGEEYVEAADAMGDAGEQWTERADEIESFCDECDIALDNIDPDPESDDEKLEDYIQRITTEVNDAFGEFPL